MKKTNGEIRKHDEVRNQGKIQLTSAFGRMLENKGMTGVLIDGKSYDVGILKACVETTLTISKEK